jgi:Protein of unknown function (DUF707)
MQHFSSKHPIFKHVKKLDAGCAVITFSILFRYIKLVRKNGLEISQPALDAHGVQSVWRMTQRRPDQEVHK